MRARRHTDHAALAINITHDVPREQYLDYITFAAPGPPMFTEIFGPLIGLKDEWADQGASPQELDLSAFRFRCPAKGGIPVSTGWIGGPPQQLIKEDDEYIIFRDPRGRTLKLCKGFATIPLPLDYPVATMDDWMKIKSHYEFSEERFAEGWEQTANEHIRSGRATVVSIPGGFDEPRQLMGEEALCMAFHDQPELVHDILSTIGDTAFRVLDRVSAAVQVDELAVHEDLAGKSGPLIGPGQVSEFIRPYYRKVWDLLESRGARVFVQDSDGNIAPVIPAFLEAGVNLTLPVEPAAGMDIVTLRETYGSRLAFMGGIDKHVLRESRERIVEELEYKIPPMVRTGGCILGLDHRIPNGTPLENYRFYIEKSWEIIDREAGLMGLADS